jgi:hypothetical protein
MTSNSTIGRRRSASTSPDSAAPAQVGQRRSIRDSRLEMRLEAAEQVSHFVGSSAAGLRDVGRSIPPVGSIASPPAARSRKSGDDTEVRQRRVRARTSSRGQRQPQGGDGRARQASSSVAHHNSWTARAMQPVAPRCALISRARSYASG